MMDQLGGTIFSLIEEHKFGLSCVELCQRCQTDYKDVEECLQQFTLLGIMKETSDGKWVICSQNDNHDDTSLDAECCEDPGSGLSHLENLSVTDTIPKARLEGNAPETSHKAVRSTGRLDLDRASPRRTELSTPASLSGQATGHHDTDRLHNREPKSNSERLREVEDLSRELEETRIKEAATGLSPYRVERSSIQRRDEAVSFRVGPSNIETSAPVTKTDVSLCDPQLRQKRDVLEKVINLFKEGDNTDLKPVHIAQKCIGKNKSKKDINRYLYCLEKHKILKCIYNNPETKSDPRWSKGDNFNNVTERDYYEMSAELSCKPGKDESHVHHHHHHRHKNIFQIGDSPTATVNMPGIENQFEKDAERRVQEET